MFVKEIQSRNTKGLLLVFFHIVILFSIGIFMRLLFILLIHLPILLSLKLSEREIPPSEWGSCPRDSNYKNPIPVSGAIFSANKAG
jgi:hypothetical protein